MTASSFRRRCAPKVACATVPHDVRHSNYERSTNVRKIAADLLDLGVRQGGLLLVHASLSSLGQVPGGPETVIQGLLGALGEEGTLLMLGCGLLPNTSFHAIEELIEPPYLFKENQNCTLRLADGHEVQKDYRIHDFVGWRQRYDRIEPFLKGEELRRGKVLAANADLIDSHAMWETALPIMKKDPQFFVEKILETS